MRTGVQVETPLGLSALQLHLTNSWSVHHLYGKPGTFGENSNGMVHPGGNFPEKK